MTATATAAPARFATREEWLVEAVAILGAEVFAQVDNADLPDLRVSVGWPGGRGKKGNVIGQCWSKAAASDAYANLFISPVLDDAVRVLDVLAHEMVHASDDCKSGHRGNFARIAKAIGLEGPMTATHAGEALKGYLAEVVDRLGAYPHGALVNPAAAQGEPKQGTRMLKVECAEGSGYIVRMTRKWLDEYGAPKCPCHDEVMAEA